MIRRTTMAGDGRLKPTDVLCRGPVQVTELPGGRVLARHGRGLSLLREVTREEVEAVLARVDGRRAAEEICRQLEGTVEPRRVIRVLYALLGEAVWRRREPRLPAMRLMANGEAGRALAARLAREGREAALVEVEGVEPAEAARLARGGEVVVWVLEGACYGALFAAQRACLEVGVASLCLTLDGDGARLGPAAAPGTPCLACAQVAALRSLGPPEAELVAAAAEFRSGHTAEHPELAAVVESAARLLAGGGEAALAGRVLHLPGPPAVGEARWYGVERLDGCPVCAGIAAAPASAVAAALARRAGERELAAAAAAPRLAVTEAAGEGVRSVGIVGGGTAGYLAALALRSSLGSDRGGGGPAVTLIESPETPIIGVGEATTPLMPQFLHADLGLDIHQLFREVAPTLKLGIRFLWGPAERPGFNYPFGPLHVLEPRIYEGHVEACSRRSLLMSAGVVPERAGELGTEVAYHLDNERFAAYLRRRAEERGVERVEATIAGVEPRAGVDGDGEIAALVARDGRRFSFDLYLDCSGFRSLLIGEALGSPFLDFGASLFADRAVVAAVPHGGRVQPYTLAETLDAGWCWSTPQMEEDHRGYVFSSAFLSPEEAEAEMRNANPGMGEARLIPFTSGRRRHFARGNAVALGNAYGFVEPLESTALHMLIRQLGFLLRSFPGDRRQWGGAAALLNRRVGAFWDYLAWFLALHYRFNGRRHTPFWRACREEVEVGRHGELLETFRDRGPLSYDPLARDLFDYPDPLWGAEGVDLLLLGQGVEARLPRPRMDRGAWERRRDLYRTAAARGRHQEEFLAAAAARPEALEDLAAAFRAAGPAFPGRRDSNHRLRR